MKETLLNRIQKHINHWYIPVIVGVLFIVLGIYVLMTPIASYLSLAIIFSWLFIFSGIAEMAFAFSNRESIKNWGWLFFSGIVDFILGAILVANPEVTLEVLPIYVGIVLMFRSIRGMSLSMDLAQYGVKRNSGLILLCLLGLIFSIFMISNLTFGAFTIVYWTSFSITMIGIYSIAIGFKFKSIKDKGADIRNKIEDKIFKIKEEIDQTLDD